MHDGGDATKKCLLIDLADAEAVASIIDQPQLGPAARDDRAATLRANRLDHDLRRVLPGLQRHAAEAHVDRRRAGIEELQQLARQRTLVRQNPCAGLHDIEIRRFLPRRQHRIRGEPRMAGEDMTANVVHLRQPHRCTVDVELLAEQRVHRRDVQLPELAVVGHIGWQRMSGKCVRRVVRRWQPDRAERCIRVADAELLSHRLRGGRRREQAARDDRITACSRHADGVELSAHHLGRALTDVRTRALQRFLEPLAKRREGRRQRYVRAGEHLRDIFIRRRAHARVRADLAQPSGERGHRLHITARSKRRQQHSHVAAPSPVTKARDSAATRRAYGKPPRSLYSERAREQAPLQISSMRRRKPGDVVEIATSG
jgi:hypothetical protein